MCSRCYEVFKLLVYKNLLAIKRNWKTALFLEILFPIILFASISVSRDLASKQSYTIPEKNYPIETKEQLLPKDILYLNVVPDNPFTQSFVIHVRNCLKMNLDKLIISRFNAEEDILKEYEVNQTKYANGNMISVIFENKSIDFFTKDLKYEIQMLESSSATLYDNKLEYHEDMLIKKTIGLQLCLDESFIKMKVKDNLFNVLISTQKLPTSKHQVPHIKVDIFRELLYVFALLAFFSPFCIEISRVQEEKLLGTNILMSINGVPYLLNILSWLFTGLILSIFYIVPTIAMLHYFATKNAVAVPMFYYGNPVIYWLIFTLHVLHSIACGSHVILLHSEAPLMVPAITVTCLYATIHSLIFDDMFHSTFTCLLGIFFPRMLLHRTFDVINYYESINVGLQWSNLFQNVDIADGYQGNMGVTLILSFIGIIGSYIFCIYVNSDRPGKCGFRKGHFNFLQCFRRSNKVEKIKSLKSENVKETNTSIIKIRNLRKYYKYNHCDDEMEIPYRGGVSIDCFQGHITVLLGHERSTIMSILTGLFCPTEGSVLIDGKNINDSLYEINDFGSCSRENLLFPSLSVAQHLQFFGKLKNRSKSKAAIQEDIETLLHKLKLIEKRNALPHELSHGQKRQLCFAIALIGDSSILILDEPTVGLDSECKRDIWNILLKMRGQKTILIGTQDMKEANILSDRTIKLSDNNFKIVEMDQPKICDYIYPQSNISVSDSLDEIKPVEQKYLKQAQYHGTHEPKKSLKDSIVVLEGSHLDMYSTKALLSEKMTHFKKILAKFYDARVFSLYLCMFYASLIHLLMLMHHDTNHNESKPVKIRLDMYNEPYYSFKYDNENELYGMNYKMYAEKFRGKRIDDLKEGHNFTNALMELGERYPLEYENKPVVAAKFIRDANVIHATALYNADKSQYAESISMNLLTNALIKTLAGTDYSISTYIKLPYGKVRTLLHNILDKISIFRGYAVAFVVLIYVCTFTAFFVTHPMFETRLYFETLHQKTKLSPLGYWGTMFAFDFIVYLSLMLIFLFLTIVIYYLLFGLSDGIHGIQIVIIITLIALSGINIIPLVYISSFAMTPIKNIKMLIVLPLAFVSMELVKNISIEFDVIDTSNIFYRVQKELFSLIPYVSFFNAQIAFFKIRSTNFNCAQISNYFKAEDLCTFNTACCAMNCNNGTCENTMNYYNGFNDSNSLEENILRLCISPIFYFILLSILEYKKSGIYKLSRKLRQKFTTRFALKFLK